MGCLVLRKATEYIKDGADEYTFISDFDFLEALEDRGHCLSALFGNLSGGLLPLKPICDVLECSLSELNRTPINETSKADMIKVIIDRHGLQEAAMIARAMLAYSMVGSLKKSQIDRDEMIKGMLEQIIGSESMTLKKRGLLWMGHWLSSAALTCLIFSVYSLLT